MQVKVWSDYICPWCYLGRDRTEFLRSLDVEVTQLPFELHPELPPSGRVVRPQGRLSQVYSAIERECVDVGLPFRAPTHVPNSRRALASIPGPSGQSVTIVSRRTPWAIDGEAAASVMPAEAPVSKSLRLIAILR